MEKIPPGTAKAFAEYGFAMAMAQALEQLMRLALAEAEVAKATRSSKTFDSQTFSQRITRADFGRLEQRICNHFKLKGEDRQIMSDARDLRNSLAHNFWSNHQGHLASPAGVDLIVRDARLFARQMERVGQFVIEKTGVDAARYANFISARATDDASIAEWDRLLAHGEGVFDRTEPVKQEAGSPAAPLSPHTGRT